MASRLAVRRVAQDMGAMQKEIQKELTPSFGKYMLAQARRGRPLPGGYIATGWEAWLTWAIDVLLTLAAAVAVTLPGIRVPYCNRCRTWYRTIRNGRIDVRTAQLLAEICHVDEIRDRSFAPVSPVVLPGRLRPDALRIVVGGIQRRGRLGSRLARRRAAEPDRQRFWTDWRKKGRGARGQGLGNRDE